MAKWQQERIFVRTAEKIDRLREHDSAGLAATLNAIVDEAAAMSSWFPGDVVEAKVDLDGDTCRLAVPKRVRAIMEKSVMPYIRGSGYRQALDFVVDLALNTRDMPP